LRRKALRLPPGLAPLVDDHMQQGFLTITSQATGACIKPLLLALSPSLNMFKGCPRSTGTSYRQLESTKTMPGLIVTAITKAT
jgi:hypothetical protein